ncbi:hypothetical protein PKB_2433 [Pseudomonas knackmussii B13]|uniref:Uncharacterized protein n=1 Tax=Pseudomonas knackmussii (strain DSM 6978 / CCUG 54928 / LMG 23759 / B13) TaxID=1301098 RepID=A0A024HFF5_PSEKB|nr:hypothetical protein [Pseudomonas knackmussii]CDF83780.1 hypothetical protein PKB_2433 [Pseudomonas knackmussii B13]
MTEQFRRAIRTTAFNNAAATELLRKVSRSVAQDWLASELEAAAVQLEIDADSLDVFAAEIQEGRITRYP